MWGLIWYPLRLLDTAGMNAIWTALVMYITAGILAIPFLFKLQVNFKHHLTDLSILAVSAALTNLGFLVALIEGEVMRVMLLFYLAPLWTVVIGRVWLGEKLSVQAWQLFFIAIIGAMIMLWDTEIGFPWPYGVGDWLALSAGFCFAVNIVAGRKLADVSMTLKTVAMWWGVAFFSVIILVVVDSPVPDVSLSVWSGAVLLGGIGMVTMNIAVLYGWANMPVYRSSIIMLFELVVGAFSAWLIINEVMVFNEWIGGGLILLAGFLLVRSQN
jgi:drug/metabolite transporter (DMT)-like permease